MESFKTILNGSDSAEYFERIAVQTGELYVVMEITGDGLDPKFSKDGKHVIFSQKKDGVTISRIIEVATNKELFSVEGESLEPAGDLRIFKKTDRNEMVRKAEQARTEGMKTVSSREEYNKLMNDYNTVIDKNTWFYSTKDNKTPRKLKLQGVIVDQFVVSEDNQLLYLLGSNPVNEYSSVYRYHLKSDKLTEIYSTKNKNSTLAMSGNYLFFGYGQENSSVGIFNIETEEVVVVEGSIQDHSNTHILVQSQKEQEKTLRVVEIGNPTNKHEIITTANRLNDAALSPSGTRVAFSMIEQSDYEVYTADLEGNITRVSHEIQHDRFPKFLGEEKLVAAKGEGRHRRSFMYDPGTGEVTKLFHNNTVRTIAPEYQWEIDPTGSKILIVAERDGNTISPERGIYLLDLNKKITKKTLLDRIDANITSEKHLKEKGERLYANIKAGVEKVVSKASVHRVYSYEEDLYKFRSKFISHSDRGVQYASNKITGMLRENIKISQSMSRKGNCWDNAAADSLFKTIKYECTNRYRFTSKEELHACLVEYIS